MVFQIVQKYMSASVSVAAEVGVVAMGPLANLCVYVCFVGLALVAKKVRIGLIVYVELVSFLGWTKNLIRLTDKLILLQSNVLSAFCIFALFLSFCSLLFSLFFSLNSTFPTCCPSFLLPLVLPPSSIRF